MGGAPLRPLAAAVLVTLAGAVTTYFATQPSLAGTGRLWALLLFAQLPVSGLALLVLYRRRRLSALLLPKQGDLMLGAITALALTVATWAGRALVTPNASVRQGWLLRLYLQLGDPAQLELLWWVHVAIILGACLDEIVWRAALQDSMKERFGPRTALWLTAGLYSLTSLPTLFTLADPVSGKNPIVWLTALGGGLLFGHVTQLTGRVGPAMVGHATFTYFAVMQFRPGL